MKRLFLHLFHMFIVKNEKAHKLAEASLLVLYKVMLFLELSPHRSDHAYTEGDRGKCSLKILLVSIRIALICKSFTSLNYRSRSKAKTIFLS